MEKSQRKIKHLVLSGGAIWGLSMIGILLEAIHTDFLNMNDIESIHATSVGSMIAVAFSLKIDPLLIRNYFIKRPWDSLCKKNRFSILDVYNEKGIIHQGFFEKIFTPLFESVELPLHITMKELYDYNGIDIHIYTTLLYQFQLVDISYKTHPEWTVIQAIHASCSIPLIFTPCMKDAMCYIDGGFLLNYPITKCVYENPEEVLGISIGNLSQTQQEEPVTPSTNIFDFIFYVFFYIIKHYTLFQNDHSQSFPYQVILYNTNNSYNYFFEVLYQQKEREDLVKLGNQTFQTFYKRWFADDTESTHCLQTESNSAL